MCIDCDTFTSYYSIYIMHRVASMQVKTGFKESFDKPEKLKELMKFKQGECKVL